MVPVINNKIAFTALLKSSIIVTGFLKNTFIDKNKIKISNSITYVMCNIVN